MFIARQPIFNRKMEIYGYELLFRSNIKSNTFGGASSISATATVMEELFESGIDHMVEDKFAFVNFDENFIYSDTLELIGPDRLVIEMLEDVKVDYRLVKKLLDLKGKGYKIALDDFDGNYSEHPLTRVAQIIKYDLIATPLKTIKEDVARALSHNKILLAEKIETQEEFVEARNMGFHLFQGYFFSKPSIVSKSYNKTTCKIQYISLLKELKKQEPCYQTLAEIIKKDVHLSYRLMRIVSSRSRDKSVNSIKRALSYLGLKEIHRWVNIMMLNNLGKSKPTELMKISMIRSKFAESIVSLLGLYNLKHEASMMGLFSALDAILDQSMSDALKDIELPDSITQALIDNRGVLSPVYQLLIAYEKGYWDEVEAMSDSLNIDKDLLYSLYISSIDWARDSLVMIA